MKKLNRHSKLHKTICLLMVPIVLVFSLSGCAGKNETLDPKNPVTLTIWHPYGHHMKTLFEGLIDEFNETIGATTGIIVQTTYVADASELNEKLLAAVDGDLGSTELPDLAIIYPRAGITLAENGLLMDFSTQFSPDELSLYVPAFLDEGRLTDDILYIMPVAKSTEIMYINATIFNRFAGDTDVTFEQLATFEGIIDAADKYYEWSSGEAFLHLSNPFNMAMIGSQQLGGDIIVDNSLNLLAPSFERIWDAYYPSAVKGGITTFDGYSDLLFASGQIVCGIGTSASVTYFTDMVTYADNTKEELSLVLLPHPVFEGGEKVTLQRGAGICVLKSDSKKEYAAGTFIKWLTEPDQNLRFTVPLGYMPVTETALASLMSSGLQDIANDNIRVLFEMIAYKQSEYTFYFPSVFDGFEDMQRNFNQSLRRIADSSRNEYLKMLDTQLSDIAYETVAQGALDEFIASQR